MACAGRFPRKGEELRRLPRAGEKARGSAVAATKADAMLDAVLLSQTSLHPLVRSRRFL